MPFTDTQAGDLPLLYNMSTRGDDTGNCAQVLLDRENFKQLSFGAAPFGISREHGGILISTDRFRYVTACLRLQADYRISVTPSCRERKRKNYHPLPSKSQ
ncbi:hypothetical protein AWB69_05844 [Caballeronia udeis]|uniref:Uncharacterized protein n=1 Tax=Caballeronia udeis TaxID=1232866 RepID=A0A158IDV6_9BURK|nr:hypothetical protein AWB69_05844 [Caballeronia udeis]